MLQPKLVNDFSVFMNSATRKLFQIFWNGTLDQIQKIVLRKRHHDFVCVGAHSCAPLQCDLQKTGCHGEFKSVANDNAIVFLFNVAASLERFTKSMKGNICP